MLASLKQCVTGFTLNLIANWRETILKLATLSAVDPQTGALNTREFSAQLHKEITRANRYDRPFSVAYFAGEHCETVG